MVEAKIERKNLEQLHLLDLWTARCPHLDITQRRASLSVETSSTPLHGFHPYHSMMTEQSTKLL